MEIGPDQVYDLFSILASILHIGNVSFVNAGGAQVSDKSGMLFLLPSCDHHVITM